MSETSSYLAEAREAFNLACPSKEPVSLFSQRQWDDALCANVLQELINSSTSAKDRARLLAVSTRESSYWLQALPSKHIGTLLDHLTLTITVGLRLGARIQQPHLCHCGETVDVYGHHSLACAKSAGRFSRHASLNGVIRRSLVTAKVPAVLEPNGLARSDGKRPDGMTLVPWKQGRSLVWDATCVDTLALSHIQVTSVAAGTAATKAERAKRRKYENIENNFIFVPFGVETMGSWGEDARSFFKDLRSA
ncbi:uncharacterized protein LOC123875316 [Maniola jurtina]|uniref:uncharacterized protein LOC123875316 n=1 Tax=Maniola jurtina TaxID=191418 RepID=UPI001E688D7F|nr:uncharacterized protein LOC123875316 [Maniola jurtina]